MSIKECWLVTADLFSSHFNPPGKRINCLRRLCPAKTAPMTLRRGHRSMSWNMSGSRNISGPISWSARNYRSHSAGS